MHHITKYQVVSPALNGGHSVRPETARRGMSKEGRGGARQREKKEETGTNSKRKGREKKTQDARHTVLL